ncbi:MAG: hypothetical protein MJ146_01430 [Clostridia bacterium]|nr:hypothetical protein [Clostridia bacterium]
MKKKVDIIIANPSGNVTIFVKTPFGRMDYQKVAGQLLDMKELKGEQVAFIKEPYPGVNGKMEMCGLEFCGNASRSFALLCAINDRMYGKCQSVVDVSGSKENLVVDLDLNSNYTKIKMPSMKSCTYSDELKGHIVDLGGIIHVVFQDREASEDEFLRIKEYINGKFNPPAMGVMFYNPATEVLVPIVYVKDVDSTYWEGSCGSGSTAVAIALSSSKEDGDYSYQLKQPAGTITASCHKEDGKIKDVFIEGVVDISDMLTVEVDI